MNRPARERLVLEVSYGLVVRDWSGRATIPSSVVSRMRAFESEIAPFFMADDNH